MGSVETEFLASVFLLPETIVVEAVYPTTTHVTVRVACVLKHAACVSVPQNGSTAGMGEPWLMCPVVVARSRWL